MWRRARRILLGAVAAFFAATVLSVLLLRFVPPLTTAFVLRGYVTAWGQGNWNWRAERVWVPYEAISPQAKIAVLTSEDQKFPTHHGFDLEQIVHAIEERESGRRVRGASTITQQVAKNLFLWSGQSFLRKGIEAYFTVLIELLWPKQRILEMYLNIAEFGDGTYGVGAAANRFFHHSAALLTPTEGATLAAVLPSPKHLRIERPSAYLQRRAQTILGMEVSLGGVNYLKSIETEVKTKPATATPAATRPRSNR